MIRATKTDVDDARQELEDALVGLSERALRWREDPGGAGHAEALEGYYERVQARAAEYETALRAWAGGPNGNDRG